MKQGMHWDRPPTNYCGSPPGASRLLARRHTRGRSRNHPPASISPVSTPPKKKRTGGTKKSRLQLLRTSAEIALFAHQHREPHGAQNMLTISGGSPPQPPHSPAAPTMCKPEMHTVAHKLPRNALSASCNRQPDKREINEAKRRVIQIQYVCT